MKHNLPLLCALGGLLAAAVIAAYALDSPALVLPPFTLIWLFFVLLLIACTKSLIDKTASAKPVFLFLNAGLTAILFQAALFGCIYYTLWALDIGMSF